MKVTCKKDNLGIECNYTEGKPEDDFDVVIYYKANSGKNVNDVADILEHVAKFVRQWKYSAQK